MATTAQRKHAVQVMEMMFSHRAQFDYPPGDQRTNRDGYSWSLTEQEMENYLARGGRPMMDCSEYAPWCLKCAGCWPWSYPGATSIHLAMWTARGWRIYTDGREAEPGALVIFGPAGGHHEAIVQVADPHKGNPMISSHGTEGLQFETVEQESAIQAGLGYPGVRYLSVAHL